MTLAIRFFRTKAVLGKKNLCFLPNTAFVQKIYSQIAVLSINMTLKEQKEDFFFQFVQSYTCNGSVHANIIM